jgi:hypothetical protein
VELPAEVPVPPAFVSPFTPLSAYNPSPGEPVMPGVIPSPVPAHPDTPRVSSDDNMAPERRAGAVSYPAARIRLGREREKRGQNKTCEP